MAEEADRAYVAALRMLARRELSEAQVRARLSRRRFETTDIEAAVTRLRRERALDDRRTALACARTAVHVRRHGRLRVLRQLEAIGVPPTVARAAVAEVFADLDERALLAQAVERRLHRGTPPTDPAATRRLHRYLLAQGFDSADVAAALRQRIRIQWDD